MLSEHLQSHVFTEVHCIFQKLKQTCADASTRYIPYQVTWLWLELFILTGRVGGSKERNISEDVNINHMVIKF